MGLGKKYHKSLAKNWCLHLKTRHPDDDNYHGIVIHIKPKFIALAKISDFEFDGVEILLKKFVKGYRDGKYEKCTNELIVKSGELTKLQSLQWLDKCESIHFSYRADVKGTFLSFVGKHLNARPNALFI